MKTQDQRYAFRKIRSRRKIFGTSERPRLSVYRSLKHIYAQVIDDVNHQTIVSASSIEKGSKYVSGVPGATIVGELLAKKAVQKGIKAVVFDRGARPYHGRIKAVAEGARKAGLQF